MKVGHRFEAHGRLVASELGYYEVFGRLTAHNLCISWWTSVRPSTRDSLEDGGFALGLYLRFDRKHHNEFQNDLKHWKSLTGRIIPTRLTWAWFDHGSRGVTFVVFSNRRDLATAIRESEILVVMES